MIYLIFGTEISIIKNRINKIAKEALSEIDEMNFVRFDGNNILIQDVIDECNYISLGYDHKVVSFENCYFLLKPKPRNSIESDQDYKALTTYLNNPNEQTDLILSVNENNIDEKSTIVSILKEKGKVMQVAEPDEKNWLDYVKSYIKDKLQVQIDNDAMLELADRTQGDIALFKNNAIKLSLYTNHITYDDINLMVPRVLEDNAFQIFNYLLMKKNIDAVALFNDLKVSSVEPVTLISMLSNQFRLLSQVSYLVKNGDSDDEGAKKIGIKPIRFKILRKNSYTFSESSILKVLDDLYNLDLQIKSGQVDRFYAFELFLIKFKVD
ncbi:MAG: DNA polymerase III subunit delta [Bacilli bacterium]|nr:DNA polymerase III subunit delta [Bacilli bacterium]